MNGGDVLILGIGNYLMGDEGVGVHFVRRLEHEEFPERVDLLDGGTAGLMLMESLESYDRVIMVDATLDGNPPGTIQLIVPKYASDFPRAMSTHEIGLKDLVATLSFLGRLPEIFLYVISVDNISRLHVGLSDPVASAMEQLVPIIRMKIDDLLSCDVDSD